MSRRAVRIDPGQSELFVSNEQSGNQHPIGGAIAVPRNRLETIIHEGPSVNLLERNAHLQNVLGRFGVMSRTAGLQFVAESGLRSELEARYDDVDQVVGKAGAKSDRKYMESKQEFAKAFGLKAIIDSGLVSPEEAQVMAKVSYHVELLPIFADARGAKMRSAMKSWLNYQERTLMGEKTRKPTTPLPKPPNAV